VTMQTDPIRIMRRIEREVAISNTDSIDCRKV